MGAHVPTPEDQLWIDASAELVPAKSLGRINDDVKSVAGSLAVVASLVTGLGLISLDRLRMNEAGYGLTVLAAGIGAFAVVLATSSFILDRQQINPSNIFDVKAWYATQLKRGSVASTAAVALILAIVFAGIGAGLAILTPAPVVGSPSLQLTGQGAQEKLSAKIKFTGLGAGVRVETKVVGVSASNNEVLVFHSVGVADSNGSLDLSGDVSDVAAYKRFRIVSAPSMGIRPVELQLAR